MDDTGKPAVDVITDLELPIIRWALETAADVAVDPVLAEVAMAISRNLERCGVGWPEGK